MLQQIPRRAPALDFHAQTRAEKLLQRQGQLLRVLELRRAVGRDQEERFEGFFVEVGRFRLDQLDGHDAERPDVDFAAVFLLLDDFGRHPIRCADHGGALGFRVGEFGAEAKVGYGRRRRVNDLGLCSWVAAGERSNGNLLILTCP